MLLQKKSVEDQMLALYQLDLRLLSQTTNRQYDWHRIVLNHYYQLVFELLIQIRHSPHPNLLWNIVHFYIQNIGFDVEYLFI